MVDIWNGKSVAISPKDLLSKINANAVLSGSCNCFYKQKPSEVVHGEIWIR
jgi:hypothetical protein